MQPSITHVAAGWQVSRRCRGNFLVVSPLRKWKSYIHVLSKVAIETSNFLPCRIPGGYRQMISCEIGPSTVHDCRTSTHHFGAVDARLLFIVHRQSIVWLLNEAQDCFSEYLTNLGPSWTISSILGIKSVKSQTLWADALRLRRPLWGYIGVWKFQVWLWINTYRYSLLGNEHPFTSYFDVHQGYKVLTHCRISTYQVKLAIFLGKHDDKYDKSGPGELGDTYTQFSDQPTKLVAQARQPAKKF